MTIVRDREISGAKQSPVIHTFVKGKGAQNPPDVRDHFQKVASSRSELTICGQSSSRLSSMVGPDGRRLVRQS